jgi:excinuclease UvrABC nuclease subunit
VALLDRFGSIRALAAATVEELITVQGIGPHAAESLHRAFSSGWCVPTS